MPTSPIDAAFECAFLVDDALNHYISVHDRIHNHQGSAASVVRNLFGNGPDFTKLLEEARSVDQLWSTVQHHVTECFTSFQNGFDPREREFFVALLPWVQAVKRTTELLCQRQEALLHKLQGDSLSLAEYQRIEREYSLSVEDYMRLGASLQPRMEKLFDENEHAKGTP